MNNAKVGPQKKKYSAPKLNDLAVEKAKAFLLNQAALGGLEGKDLLNLLTQTSA